MKGANPPRSGVQRGVGYDPTKHSSTGDSARLEKGGGWLGGSWFTSRPNNPEGGWLDWIATFFQTDAEHHTAREEIRDERAEAAARGVPWYYGWFGSADPATANATANGAVTGATASARATAVPSARRRAAAEAAAAAAALAPSRPPLLRVDTHVGGSF